MSVAEMTWLNPPPHHTVGDGTLTVRTGKDTDFWRETFYGFWRDNGHFLHRPVEGDFSAEVTVKGDYKVLYDQAGLMLRLSETHWIKAGIEYTDGLAYFSVVVTNDTSDWSLVAIAAGKDGVRIRLTRHAEAIRLALLAMIASLEKRGLLRYDTTRTNREYRAELRPRPELAEPFGRLARIYEGVWYGRQPAGPEQAEESIRLCVSMIDGEALTPV